ncbi:cation-translocating P-type ATPase [Streptomyces sp. RS10V-4]|uniref:cation-translocating P-type ATPase n=1 Tax=Streptomyces rhizoryzae TaxID=2932493 RepID=UPI002002A219|nr:cation-translocating P-type ATPase [Streptomyces rhizoryzae]MCK7624344.1 cation-translocating P-type ATPase [Streptomyces rhizoryzae]
MVVRQLIRIPGAGLALALGAPAAAVCRALPTARTVTRLAVGAAGAGFRGTVHGAAAAADTARRVGRVSRNAADTGRGYWQAGSRLQLPLRPRADAGGRARGVEAAAGKVAAALAQQPEVVAAYWDGGLARLVVQMTKDAVTDRVIERAAELATAHRLERTGDDVLETAHPDHIGGVRAQALGLACDAVGLATAVGARAIRLKHTPRLLTAATGLLREDPGIAAALRKRFGDPGCDLLLAAAGAAAYGIGRSPGALALDAVLRTGRLLEAIAGAAAFDAAQDSVCGPGRLSLAAERTARPALRPLPSEQYAAQAVAGGLLGAASAALLARNLAEAAEALVAGNPKAARYGPAAFTAALGTELAREGVLVRNLERLRRLELVDAVVLHPDALRGTARTVLQVHPNAPGWDHDRLWQAAAAALDPGGAEPGLALRPVPDQEGPAPGQDDPGAGLMVASAGGRDVGTVLVGREIDPLAESALDAARRAGLHVVVADDGTLGDFGALADQRVGAERPLADVVRELQQAGRVVLTLARLPVHGTELTGTGREVLAGLLRGDLAVAVTDAHSAVVWGADILLPHGLEPAWRLLAAIPAARMVARHAKTFAEAGAALSGLLVLTRGRRAAGTLSAGLRLTPVHAAAGASLVSGWRAALRVSVRSAPHPPPRIPWHALAPQDALARLRAVARPRAPGALPGREEAGAAVRRIAALPLFAPVRPAFQLARAVRSELDDPLTPVLLVGALASALLGSVVDAVLVTGALGMNALIGGVQRLRAERALSALEERQRRTARVVDGERTRTVDADHLSPGQVIEVRTGEVVPADARLLDLDDLEVDESALTGESLPTAKQLAATPEAPVADRRCMLFEGTTVVAGQARAAVVGTGDGTEAGRAAHLAARTPPAPGVQARLRELTNRSLPFTLLGGAAVAALALLRGRPVRQAVRGGLAVAVAAVPEGLPLVATVAQMAAARRLSAKGVLVRTPRTLEALGRMDTVCFDKTGTLTENRLRVTRTATPDGRPHDAGTPGAEPVLRLAARACPPPAAGTATHAHSTDEAVLAAAPDDPAWEHAASLPFEASRGYAAATGSEHGGPRHLVVKGAPEVVLPACTGAGDEAAAAATALADEGLRVLAVATRRADQGAGPAEDPLDQPLDRLELAGFVALADSPRAGAAELVTGLRRAGVRPVMLTGDHSATARAVAARLGWPEDAEIATGDELAGLDQAGRARRLRGCEVVARVAPEQKVQVIEALREAGRVVAMVGDGANDAAAIRAADIGVGIAARGSAAARNAADLVLTGDRLTALTDAVAEGRALWRSVADAISILIGGNAGEIGFSVLGTLLSGAAPMSTRQILLVNLLTDMFPAMAVAVTPRDDAQPGGDTASPRAGLAALDEPLAAQIRRRGLVTALGAATAWLIGTLTPGTARRTSTMALCGVVGAQLTQTLTGRRRSPLVLGTVLGSALVLAVLIETPGVSGLFGCRPLGPVAWAGVATAIGVAAAAPHLLPHLERRFPHAVTRVLALVTATGLATDPTTEGGA